MSYDNPLPKIEKAKYLISNDTQKVVQLELVVSAQSEAAFVTNIMSQSVDNRLGQEVTNAVQEVLTGQTDLRSFYVGDYQGMAQIRNQRVEIRIWDRQFSF